VIGRDMNPMGRGDGTYYCNGGNAAGGSVAVYGAKPSFVGEVTSGYGSSVNNGPPGFCFGVCICAPKCLLDWLADPKSEYPVCSAEDMEFAAGCCYLAGYPHPDYPKTKAEWISECFYGGEYQYGGGDGDEDESYDECCEKIPFAEFVYGQTARFICAGGRFHRTNPIGAKGRRPTRPGGPFPGGPDLPGPPGINQPIGPNDPKDRERTLLDCLAEVRRKWAKLGVNIDYMLSLVTDCIREQTNFYAWCIAIGENPRVCLRAWLKHTAECFNRLNPRSLPKKYAKAIMADVRACFEEAGLTIDNA